MGTHTAEMNQKWERTWERNKKHKHKKQNNEQNKNGPPTCWNQGPSYKTLQRHRGYHQPVSFIDWDEDVLGRMDVVGQDVLGL